MRHNIISLVFLPAMMCGLVSAAFGDNGAIDPAAEMDKEDIQTGARLLGIQTESASAGSNQDQKDGLYGDRSGALADAFNKLVAEANQGDKAAQYQVGRMYERGKGVEQNIDEALAWYGKSAAQGLEDAQRALGIIYLDGKGVDKDYKKALHWLGKGAEQGGKYSQMLLSRMYRFGQGTERDMVLAHMWNILSYRDDNSIVKSIILEKDEKTMTREQIAAARQKAQEWIARWRE